ncbi:AAA domain-containing protein [Nitrogeniibacter mangrovi]|uniref:AAA domain-containing protein n=1 Tax=Nitrogeniibacter mangrovi TaxID=2016596 RepID=A0A6C1B209_9RHOO|nr:sigma-54-dependent Fis family transcriptional regulator [Nitrogeniibacter mangrovi]QID16380.1 AAA domain-containing protein [Nitrogeniibacter mangrovi]
MAVDPLIEKFNLRSRLRFDLDAGRIWLGENRMLLLHAQSLGALRRELFDTLGATRAKGLLLRMGFLSGQKDAELARKLVGEGDNFDVFRIGPQLHAFEGLVKVKVSDNAAIDWSRRIFRGEAEWEGSWEAESHLQSFGPGDEPACWSLVGYASGYTSNFFKRQIVFKETHCVARGDEHCVIVGKPVEEWGDDPYLAYFDPEDVDGLLRKMAAELDELRGRLRTQVSPGWLVGSSAPFRHAFDLLSKAARSPINVLLLGETGVGKELFARWLHEHSERAARPFVAINCGAIPHELIESELFGVQKGAFTGAQQSRPGRFERADGGTLFLDEVGDLSPATQVKLLRVLQSGELERLGDQHTRTVDVRVVAATNVDLKQAIADGRFRADLYYRLATYPVTIPPLRERKSDIPLLVAALTTKYVKRYDKRIEGVSDRAMETLMAHDWPGNVRELENLVERGVLLAPEGGRIELEHLFAEPPAQADVGLDASGVVGRADVVRRERTCEALLDEPFDLNAFERRMLDLAVARAGGNLARAARMLGITRRQLDYRLKRDRADRPSRA